MPPFRDDVADLDRTLTVREFREFRVELEARLQAFATKDDLKATRDELRSYIDLMIESFKTEFANLYDWTRSTTDSLAKDVAALEAGHGARITSLETRVTRLEDVGRRARRKE